MLLVTTRSARCTTGPRQAVKDWHRESTSDKLVQQVAKRCIPLIGLQHIKTRAQPVIPTNLYNVYQHNSLGSLGNARRVGLVDGLETNILRVSPVNIPHSCTEHFGRAARFNVQENNYFKKTYAKKCNVGLVALCVTGPRSACLLSFRRISILMLMNIKAWGPQVTQCVTVPCRASSNASR